MTRAVVRIPARIAEHVKQWRKRRDGLPDRPDANGPPQDGEANLGVLSTAPFRYTAPRQRVVVTWVPAPWPSRACGLPVPPAHDSALALGR